LNRLLGLWLTEKREARNWTVADIRSRLHDAARHAGDTLPGNDILGTMIRRWEQGHATMPDKYQHYYSHALGITIQELGTAPVPDPPDGTTTAGGSDRAELTRLRRENAELADDRDALRRCLAISLRDTTPAPTATTSLRDTTPATTATATTALDFPEFWAWCPVFVG
jgi:hypothetical protein